MTFDAQKQQFAAEGYAVFDRVLSEDTLAMLRDTGTRHLRNNAVPLLRKGEHVTTA